MKRSSAIVAGVFSESEMIQSTGISAKSSTTTMRDAPERVLAAFRVSSQPPVSLLGERGPEALDEDERDQDHAEEDQHRDRRAEPEVQRG